MCGLRFVLTARFGTSALRSWIVCEKPKHQQHAVPKTATEQITTCVDNFWLRRMHIRLKIVRHSKCSVAIPGWMVFRTVQLQLLCSSYRMQFLEIISRARYFQELSQLQLHYLIVFELKCKDLKTVGITIRPKIRTCRGQRYCFVIISSNPKDPPVLFLVRSPTPWCFTTL